MSLNLQRRMLVTEKVSENVLGKVSISKDMIESYFAVSPDIKALQSAAVKVDGIQVELRSLSKDLRDTALSITRLEGSSAKLNDFGELRERLAFLEPLSEQFESSKLIISKLDDDVRSLRGKVSEDSRELLSRVSKSDGELRQISKSQQNSSSDVSALTQRLATLEGTYKTRTGEVENKLAVLLTLDRSMAELKGSVSTLPGLYQRVSVLTDTQIPSLLDRVTTLEQAPKVNIAAPTPSVAPIPAVSTAVSTAVPVSVPPKTVSYSKNDSSSKPVSSGETETVFFDPEDYSDDDHSGSADVTPTQPAVVIAPKEDPKPSSKLASVLSTGNESRLAAPSNTSKSTKDTSSSSTSTSTSSGTSTTPPADVTVALDVNQDKSNGPKTQAQTGNPTMPKVQSSQPRSKTSAADHSKTSAADRVSVSSKTSAADHSKTSAVDRVSVSSDDLDVDALDSLDLAQVDADERSASPSLSPARVGESDDDSDIGNVCAINELSADDALFDSGDMHLCCT